MAYGDAGKSDAEVRGAPTSQSARGIEPTASLGTNRQEWRNPSRLRTDAASDQMAAMASLRSITRTVIVERISALQKVPCPIANPPSIEIPAAWNDERSFEPNAGPDAEPAPAMRAALVMENVVHARMTGTMPMMTAGQWRWGAVSDRKSTRLNSSHLGISYAVFCLEKKK